MTFPPPQDDSLPDSRLYTFVDRERALALYFFEGQRLIRDLALLHGIRGGGFAYFRDVVLTVQPLIALLKPGEQLGFYIDSSEPYFRLKIETGHHGATRCALVPDDFAEFPATMQGIVRLLKLFPHNRPPYESVIQADGLALGSIINRVLQDSYQVDSVIRVSRDSDQSAMLHRLPTPDAGAAGFDGDAAGERRAEVERVVERIHARALHDPDDIERAFRAEDFELLAGRPVRFRCACSRERMIRNIRLACGSDYEQLFDPGQAQLEIICEYCKTQFLVGRDDLRQAIVPPN